MMAPPMRLLHRSDDRVFRPHGFCMELGMLVAQVFFELRFEPEPQGALGALEGFHRPIVAQSRSCWNKGRPRLTGLEVRG